MRKRDVGKVTFKVAIESAKDLGVPEALLEKAVAPYSENGLQGLKNGKEPVSWECLVSFLKACSEYVKDDEIVASRIAHFGVFGKAIHTFKNFVSSFWGLKYLYYFQSKVIFKILWPCIDMELTDLGSGQLLVRKKLADGYEDLPLFWDFYKKVYELFPCILGCPKAKVNISAGEGECYFYINLPKGRSLFSNFIIRSRSIITHFFNLPENHKSKRDVILNLLEVNDSLEVENEKLERSLKVKSNLLKLFGHDTRNSFQVINATIHNLKRKAQNNQIDSELVLRRMEPLSLHTNNLKNIQQMILDFEKSVNDPNYTHEINHVSDIVDHCLELHKDYYMAKGVYVDIDLKEDFKVKGDKTIIAQSVIGNLLSNAVKFSTKGSRVLISINKGIISVRDFGAGMSSSELTEFLDLDNIVSNAEKHGEAGIGFGTRICYYLVENLGGQLHVESSTRDLPEFKKGTEFQISLPMA